MNKTAKHFLSHPKLALGFQKLALPILMGVLIDVHATTIDMAGSYTTGDVNISSTLGTNGTVEASVKLKASGPITYNYAFKFDLDVDTPASMGAGDTFTATPFLANTQASLAASQNVRYTNDFSFLLNVPDGLPGIPNQVGFSNVTVPRFEIQDQGFVYLRGDGTLNSTGNTFTDNYLGRGYVTANGDFLGADNSSAAWRAGGVDIFDIALAAAGLPPLPGFELYPTAGIDILREDQAWLVDYEFTDPLQFTIPDNLNIGDVFNFSIDTYLKYDLGFYSFFAYEGNLLLEFDIPDWIPGLPEAYDIKLTDLGEWDVAVVSSELNDLLLPITISGSVTLGEVPEVCERFAGTQFYMSCLLHVTQQEPLDEAMRLPPEYPMPVADRTFDVEEVPEPNGLALLAIGLLGMTWMRRRQLQAGAIAASFAGMAALGLSAGVQATPLSADIVVLVDQPASMAG